MLCHGCQCLVFRLDAKAVELAWAKRPPTDRLGWAV